MLRRRVHARGRSASARARPTGLPRRSGRTAATPAGKAACRSRGRPAQPAAADRGQLEAAVRPPRTRSGTGAGWPRKPALACRISALSASTLTSAASSTRVATAAASSLGAAECPLSSRAQSADCGSGWAPSPAGRGRSSTAAQGSSNKPSGRRDSRLRMAASARPRDTSAPEGGGSSPPEAPPLAARSCTARRGRCRAGRGCLRGAHMFSRAHCKCIR